MKNELKALYKKDKKLAIEVAQVLGYKIKVKLMTKKEALSNLNDAAKLIFTTMDTLADEVDLPDNIEKLGLNSLASLKKLRIALNKL